MTREEASKMAKAALECMEREVGGCDEMCNSHKCDECALNYEKGNMGEQKEWLRLVIKALEQEPCDDLISRQAAIDTLTKTSGIRGDALKALYDLPPVIPQSKMGYCKDCKYFEYDSAAKVDGIPLIVAHEICSRWGNGCKTKEDGYCFLFEPKMQETGE